MAYGLHCLLLSHTHSSFIQRLKQFIPPYRVLILTSGESVSSVQWDRPDSEVLLGALHHPMKENNLCLLLSFVQWVTRSEWDILPQSSKETENISGQVFLTKVTQGSLLLLWGLWLVAQMTIMVSFLANAPNVIVKLWPRTEQKWGFEARVKYIEALYISGPNWDHFQRNWAPKAQGGRILWSSKAEVQKQNACYFWDWFLQCAS